jgi:phage I-like protein
MPELAEKDALCYVLLADARQQVPETGDESDWFPILKTGTWQDPRYGELVVTRSDLEKAVENFKLMSAKEVEIGVDYDHSFALSGDSRAAGWYTALRTSGDKLEAKVKWTTSAVQAIKAGEYRYFSSEYHEKYAHDDLGKLGFTILSGALTNRPAVKGLGTVALSEDAQAQVKDSLVEIGDLLGFAVTAESRANIRGEDPMPKLVDDKGKEVTLTEVTVIDAEGKEVKLEVLPDQVDGVKALNEHNEKLRGEIEEAKKAVETAPGDDQVKTLTETVKRQGAELTDEKFLRVFSQAKREGRVDNKDETEKTWRERVDKFGLDEVSKLLNELPADTIPMKERGGAGVETPAAKHDGTADLDSPEGRKIVLTEAEKIVEESEGKIELADALVQVERKLRTESAAGSDS